MFNELVKSIALLLALCFLHGMQMRWWPREARGGRTASGLLFGTVCAIGMLAPVVSVPGAAIDVRTVVLSLAGVFGGPLVALIAAAMAAAARLWIGGAGTLAGLLVIALSATLGCAFRWAHLQGKLSIRPLHLLGLAVVVHVLALGVATALPSALALSTHRGIILPLLLLSLPLTALVGWLLQDVENRLATERALRESTARLHAVTHAISDGLLVLDERGAVLEVLSPDHTCLPAPPAQLRGRRLQDALPPEQAAQWMALLYQTLASGQAQHMAYRIDTPQGPRCYEGRAHPLGLLQGGLRTVVFAAHDTTEQQQTLAALRESELRFRTLLHDIPSISVQGYLPDRTTTYWNKASEQLYGYTEQEA
ncbi:MAG: LytS/YhcK type 5TM receptor domain-containing protein, partial [Giesbergeria sp.]